MADAADVPKLIDRVDFGRYDAESDPNVLEYFLVTGTTREAAEGIQLVVGRKGAGKTALFKHLQATNEGRVVDLDLMDYVFQVHRSLVETGIGPEFAYTSSWRLLILASMFAHVRDDLDRKDRKVGDEVLAAIGMGPNGRPFRAMVDWMKRVRRVDLPSIEGLATVGGLEVDAPEESALATETATAIKRLEDLMARVVPSHRVTVLIDRLDDAWDGSEESLALITGAVRATRSLALTLRQSGPAPVITFLRTDLWEKLSFNDRNKMSQDIIFLDWSEDELADVIERRISSTAGVAEGQGWAQVFTRNEMRQRASARTYILKRTIGRPRDVVAFASFALKSARANGHDRIEAEDIYEAERRYSKHALDELRDEIERHVVDFNQVINAIKRLEKKTFSAVEWTRATAAVGLSAADSEVALEQLFESSTVGVHRAGGASGGSRTTFRYQDRHLRSSDEALLQVHRAFVRELSLRDS